ncbi:MAG: hypothetical protein KatS3mg106_691 [Gemmataceae bacterium]|nr:MAG: hypothetical protein KatS3mg106_691 [Gemmataceae bacterium]
MIGGTYWIGTLIEHEGVQYVQHGQYWVPLAEVKGAIERTFTVGYGGEWRKDPNKITVWFRKNNVRVQGIVKSLNHTIDGIPQYSDEEKKQVKKALAQLIEGAQFEWNQPVGFWGKCHEWTDEYERRNAALLTRLRQEGVLGKLIDVDNQCWYNVPAHSTLVFWGAGHAAIRITLLDGSYIYLDDGNWGKGDKVFFPRDVP